MNHPRQLIYKLRFVWTISLVFIFVATSLAASSQATANHATDCSDVFTPLSQFVRDGATRDRAHYERAMSETGVPWEMLAAIHYRETNFSHTNPNNGQGIFQFVNGDGGPYPPGPVSEEEFYRQLKFMATRVQDDYVWRGSVPRERRRLVPGEQNVVLIKDTLFSYNGRAGVYADQAVHFGYNRDVQPYEGSPYVMNRFDCPRARMGIITQDYGSMDGIDTRYGTFTVFARLRGDTYWQSMLSPYAWGIESFTYSGFGNDNNLIKGEAETLTLRARNTGRNPWYNHGDFPIRLGTWEPANRSSSLFTSNRLANLTESVVQPGQVGTFTVQVIPSQLGTFVESLNLVAENYQWMAWTGFRPTIHVGGPYQWQIQTILYEKGTGVMDPGSSQLITLIAKNTGSVTWDKNSGAPIRLGTWQPQRQSTVGQNWLSSTRVTNMNENTVAPGQTAGFQFYVRMPATGQHYERLNLVAEGQTWLNDPGLTLYLFGNDYTWSIQSIEYSSGTGLMVPNTVQTITVKAKNTGTATWQKSGNYPVRLGTWVPQRVSNVTENWMSSTRMAELSENSVAPGQVGTFTAQVRMPSTGLYYERMNLVAEGFKWLNDPGLTFYLEGRNL